MLNKLKRPLYSNCVILDPEGQVLCRSGERRMNWYLNKGLADKVSDVPPTIKLKFKPGGIGDSGDPYMLQAKENRCVVCGGQEDLTRHHVVPYCYRAHFPDEAKNHTSYDILPLCVPCHEMYELEARKLRRGILDELKLAEHGMETDWTAVKAIKAANAILRHGNKIPEDRRSELRADIMEFYKKTDLTDEDIAAAAKLEWKIVPEDYACASAKVVESQTNIDDFAKRWREHFLSVMQPKFMPSNWETDKRLYQYLHLTTVNLEDRINVMDWNLICEHCSVWYSWATGHWYLYLALPMVFFALRFMYDIWNWWNWDKDIFPYGDETGGILFAGLLIWPIALFIIVGGWFWEHLDNYRLERLRKLGRK